MKRTLAIIGLVAVAALGTAALAFTNSSGSTDDTVSSIGKGEIRALEWEDLAPALSSRAQGAAAELNMRIDQMTDDEIISAMDLIQSEGGALVTELDDTDVSIEGFLVPLDFDAEEASEFVLVPYFGACIHVPPPPANQIVYVKFREGLPMAEFEAKMYAPFTVKGRIKASPTKTQLADVGYQLTAIDIKETEEY